MNIIRLVIEIPGVGKEAHEYDYCLIAQHGENRNCPIGGGICNYGLTEVSPPETCPMKSGKFTQEVIMKFSIVEREI